MNHAAVIYGPRTMFVLESCEIPKATKGEVIIRNHAVAVNPIDWKVQEWGIFLHTWPNILGADVAGEVYEVGEGVSQLKKGDRVIGHAFSLVTNNGRNGGFQLYTACNALVVAKIPTWLPYTSAAVLPLSISTAAQCLFNHKTLDLSLPSLISISTGESVLVWGGTGSVGATAVQLAVAAGVKVISVAGQYNISNVKDLGAAEVFDYKPPTVAEDIIKAVEGTKFLGICDCIGTSASVLAWSPIYEKLGGRYGTVLPPPAELPFGIEGANVLGPDVAFNHVRTGEAVWADYIPKALELGRFKPGLEPFVFRGGLQRVQDAVSAVMEGLSFRKAVVEL